ncbi:unnamed protein product, partial [marine sediment metagenome]
QKEGAKKEDRGRSRECRNTAVKNRPGLRRVELRISHPPTPGTLLLSYKDLNGGPGESKGGFN